MTNLLTVASLTTGYGAAQVLLECSFDLLEGLSLALLGRNGMGKTTLLTSLLGLTDRHAGRLHFNGQDITTWPPERRAAAGIGWVPQERNIFRSLTVEENLTAIARPGPWDVARVYTMFPRLQERRRNLGGQLSGGEQQMLAVGRALVLNPRLLLLDEPTEGLAPVIVEELLRVIRHLTQQEGMTAIIVEQHAHKILGICARALVLDRGRIAFDGNSRQLQETPALLDDLLGVGHSD